MECYIRYNEEFKLVICIACKEGIPSTFILRHFRIHHNSTWKERRTEFCKYVEGLDLCITKDLPYVEELRDLIEGLDIKEGWCCGEDDCRVSSISLKYIENHCRNAHGNEAFKRKAWFGCHMPTLLGLSYIIPRNRCSVFFF